MSTEHRGAPRTSWVCLLGASEGGLRALRRLGVRCGVVLPATPVVTSVLAEAELIATCDDLQDVEAVERGIGRLERALGPPSLVLSFTELGQATAARCAASRELPGLSPQVVRRIRDKGRMRQTLAGTPWAWPHIIGTAQEIRAQLSQMALDPGWVVKPIDGYGSQDIFVLTGPTDLQRWYRRSPTTSEVRWIAERLANGTEYSVEAVSFGPGLHRIIAVTEKHTTGAPRFVELGHCLPAPLDAPDRLALDTAVGGILTALGVTVGPTHTEMRMDETHGLVLIETHSRPGGDCIPELAELVTGIDQYGWAIASLLDQPTPAEAARTVSAAAIRFLTAQRAGTFGGVQIRTTDTTKPRGATLERVTYQKRIGDQITAPTNSDDRIGYAIVSAPDATTAVQAAEQAVAELAVQSIGPAPTAASSTNF